MSRNNNTTQTDWSPNRSCDILKYIGTFLTKLQRPRRDYPFNGISVQNKCKNKQLKKVRERTFRNTELNGPEH